jgi:D-alanyl-D-alanine endopeptidase (penicillin-binding protein 7)
MSADTVFRLTRGEQVLNEHLMEAMLVSSLNTPSRILASTLDISEKQFIAHMNTTVRSLGLSSTTFTDTSGLDLGNQTTAREYLKLYLRATKNSTVKRIMSMNSYEYDELRDVDGKPHHIDNHTNALVAKKNLPFSIITSKTGYLPESGNHLVMHIERLSDKKQFIVMTMGNNNKANKFDAPEQLARWAVANL